jgi:hypothetical protein
MLPAGLRAILAAPERVLQSRAPGQPISGFRNVRERRIERPFSNFEVLMILISSTVIASHQLGAKRAVR